MSWLSLTIIFVLACLACAFGLCEWLIKRRRDANESDRDFRA